ncbi:MAG: tRNA pseudouridine(55) synthase TruB [Armatimonadetes bacterium]|nr:tRNA pseudouridine(55) synthase TruB [Armatimonadota bacterium]
MHGLVVIDKPSGPTSHDVVSRCRRLFQQRKIGHAGTLDPLATGVLVMGLGHATRLLEYVHRLDKEYMAEFHFGLRTDTQDISGQIISRSPMAQLTSAKVAAVIPQFLGNIVQVPPVYSAIHHEGRRLYEMARAGVDVKIKPRAVQIYEMELIDFLSGEYPVAKMRIRCGTGVYIRTIAGDMGDALGGGGAMGALRRIRVGRFDLAGSVTLEQIEATPISDREGLLLPILKAVESLPKIQIISEQLNQLVHGRPVEAPKCLVTDDGEVAVLDSGGKLAAIAEIHKESGWLRPKKVLAPVPLEAILK